MNDSLSASARLRSVFATFLLPLVSFVALTACEGAPVPTQTWSPADHDQPPRREVDPSRIPRPSSRSETAEAPEGAAEERAAAALFNVMCASCHGREGLGNGPSAPGVLANFQDPEWQRSRSDADIASVIRLGRGMMPAFGEQIVPAGIEALVGHVRRLGNANAEPAPTDANATPTGEPSPEEESTTPTP